MADPSFLSTGGIRIENSGVEPADIPSFGNFFDQDQYIDNPFGKDFIKLEIDVEKFGTNKTSKLTILYTMYVYILFSYYF